jgi:hypothetical protein
LIGAPSRAPIRDAHIILVAKWSVRFFKFQLLRYTWFVRMYNARGPENTNQTSVLPRSWSCKHTAWLSSFRNAMREAAQGICTTMTFVWDSLRYAVIEKFGAWLKCKRYWLIFKAYRLFLVSKDVYVHTTSPILYLREYLHSLTSPDKLIVIITIG